MSGARAGVWVRCSERCMVKIGLWLQLGSISDVRAREIPNFRFTEKRG